VADIDATLVVDALGRVDAATRAVHATSGRRRRGKP